MQSRLVRLLACGLLIALVSASMVTAKAADQMVRVYNWSDYIDESILQDFTRETGIDVVYDVYDSNSLLETKLLAGGSGYDVVFPSGQFLARQIRAGVFQELDRTKLPNWKNLDPVILERVERYDPGNLYGVVYMWGTTGIAYNDQMIGERLPNAPRETWSLVFDPQTMKRLQDCGVIILDAEEDMIPTALNYLGENPDSKEKDVIEKAGPPWMAVRPYVRKFHSSESINAIANGDICLAVMYSGDALQASSRAADAGKDFQVVYTIPKEGALMWFDLMAIPADAPDPDAAHAFINYLMQPEVIARATNYVSYANANRAAKPFVNPEILGNPLIYPPPEVQEKLFVTTPYDLRTQRVVTRLWQRIKTGH